MDNMTDTDNGPTSVGPFNIGLDPGFGGVKAACIGLEGARAATVPSVVGVGQTDLGLLSVGNLGRRRRSRRPDQVTFDKITCLVGENVARYARPVERMDFLRLSDGPELRSQFYDLVFRLLGEGAHHTNGSARSFQNTLTINVMVGLPVEVMADREQALEERLERARELYLAGDISRDRYLEEKWAAEVALTSFHPLPKDAIMAAGSYLSDFDHLWSEAHSYPEKARLLRSAVAAVFVKGRSLVAIQPTESFFPLMHYCWSGSDGHRLPIEDDPEHPRKKKSVGMRFTTIFTSGAGMAV